jgi:hypothetical protein
MVRPDFPEGHGAREETTRHVITPRLAAMLAAARRRLSWSQREAARKTGVAYGMIGHLEHCRRAPSSPRRSSMPTSSAPPRPRCCAPRQSRAPGATRPSGAPPGHLWERDLGAPSMVRGGQAAPSEGVVKANPMQLLAIGEPHATPRNVPTTLAAARGLMISCDRATRVLRATCCRVMST